MWRVESRIYLGDYRAGVDALGGAALPTDPSGDPKPFAGVVSLCPMPLFRGEPVEGPALLDTEWLKIPIMDGGNGDGELEYAIDLALPFIARRRKSGNVLVHCAAGMSRSVSVLAALLCEGGSGVEEAFEHIASSKAEALGPFSSDLSLLIAPAWEFRRYLERRYGRTRPDGRPDQA